MFKFKIFKIQDVENIQNSSRSQSLQNVKITQQPVTMHQNISQLSERNPEQIINYQTDQVLPVIKGTIPSIEVQPQQLQQLPIPLVQNVSGAISDNVQLMNILNTSSDSYKNVPSSKPTTINDTLATKLLNNKKGEVII
jgi:hypothetical protein